MLPIFQSDVKELTLLQTSWASLLNPLLKKVPLYVEEKVTDATVMGVTNTWFDCTSLLIPEAGQWELFGQMDTFLNGATMTNDITFGLSTNAGNNGNDLLYGDSKTSWPIPTSTANSSGVITITPQLTKPKRFYLKMLATYSAGSPQFRCKLTAKRLDLF